MERQPSLTGRVRKLSNTIKNAIVPSSSSNQAQSKRTRKLSVDYIGKPRVDPAYSIDAWLPTKGEREASRPPRPHRPSMDERPLVIRDPEERGLEQQRLRDANTLRRPERPSESELPYGIKGSVPVQDALLVVALVEMEKVAFPAPPRKTSPPRPVARRTQTGESSAQDRSPPGPSRVVFSPFAPMARSSSLRSTRTMPERTRVEVEEDTPSTTRVGTPELTIEEREGLRARMGKGKGRAANEAKTASVYCAPEEAATVRRQGAIRRPSKGSDASLPSLLLRDRFGRSEDTLVAPPAHPTSLQRSHSTATRGSLKPRRAPPSPSPLKPRPEPRDVPRDVELRHTQDSLLRWEDSSSTKSSEVGPMLIPPAPVATKRVVEKARANMPLRYPPVPRDVQLSAPDPQRASSFKAEVGHVGAESTEGSRREKPGRKHARKGAVAEVEYIPLTKYYDEVALANGLAQEAVPPLPALLPSAGPSTSLKAPEPLRVLKRDSREREAEVKTKTGGRK